MANKFFELKKNKFYKTLINKASLFVFFLTGSGLLLLSVIWLNQFGAKFNPNKTFREYSVVIKPPKVNNSSVLELVTSSDYSQYVTLNIEGIKFSPRERILTGTAKISIPNILLENLWSSSEHITNSENYHSTNIIPKNEYEDLEFSLLIFSAQSGSKHEIKIPVSDLFSVGNKKVVEFPISLDFLGESSTYPGDWYLSNSFFYLALPNSIWLQTDTGFSSTLPIRIYLSSNFQMDNFNMKVRTHHIKLGELLDENEKEVEGAYYPLDILITRDPAIKLYTFAMSLLPFLLSLVYAHSCIYNRKKFTENTFLEITAIIFTVLPLRSVLLPENIDGVVRVDLILGFDVAFLVFISLLYYVIEKWNNS